MARKNNIPEEQVQPALNEQVVELSHSEKLSMASEMVVRTREDSLRRIEERAKSFADSENEAKRRSEEMKKSREAAEKQAKSVVERKLAELSYAENYRKKLLKDKENSISASRARELERRAAAQQKARLDAERQIAELIESEKQEARERRAKTEAMLERAALARKKAEELPQAPAKPSVEDVTAVKEELVSEPIEKTVAEEAAPVQEAMPKAVFEVADEQTDDLARDVDADGMKLDFDATLTKDGKVVGAIKKDNSDDDMVFRLPEMKLGSASDAKKKAEVKAPAADATPNYSAEPFNYGANYANPYSQEALNALQASFGFNTTAGANGDTAVNASEITADISALAEVLAVHDEELRRIRAERVRILADLAAGKSAFAAAAVAADVKSDNVTAEEADGDEAAFEAAEATEEQINADEEHAEELLAEAVADEVDAADAERIDKINVVENPQHVYDEEAIKQDIENMNRRSLKVYLKKCENRLEKLQASAKRAEKKLKRADEYERLERILATLGIYKDIIDLLCENLKCCTLFSVKKYYASYQKRIAKAVGRYNELVDEYTALTGNTLTKLDPSVAVNIVNGDAYIPLPIITYTKETIEILPEDEAISEDGKKVAKPITLSEKKLQKKLNRAVKKKEACATVSQTALMLAECITIERDMVELLAAKMRDAVAAGKKSAIKDNEKKLSLAITEYNAFVDEYELLSGNSLVKASESIPADIAEGKEYQPLPEISYNRHKMFLDKSAKDLAREKKAVAIAIRKGEAMPEKEAQLGGYISANCKKVNEIAKFAKKCEKKRRKKKGEDYNRAVLNVAMLRGKIVALHRDNLVAAYRLDSEKYVDVCKSELAHSVRLYNDEIALYNNATGIKLIMIAPGIADDIASGRSYQTVPTLEWRERFAELSDGDLNDEKKVFVFPTLSEISKEQTLASDPYVQSASFGEDEFVNDKLVLTPINTAKYFKRFTVNKKRKLRAYDKKVKTAEHDLRHEISRTEKQISQASDFGKVRYTVKKLILNRDIVNLRIKGLEYSVRFADKKRVAYYKNAVISAMVDYNACVYEYEQLTGEKLTPASAFVPYDIIDGREYTKLPIIVYRREFIETNGASVRAVATLVKQNEEYKATMCEAQQTAGAVPVPTAYPAADEDSGKKLTKAEKKRAKRKEKKHGKSKELTGASDTDESAQRTSSNDSVALETVGAVALAAGASTIAEAATEYVNVNTTVNIDEYANDGEYNVDAWNSASMSQYRAELAENAAAEAKNRADIAEYHSSVAAYEAANSENSSVVSEYHKNLANASAINADNSARMATYYAVSAEDSLKRSEYLAAQARVFEEEAKQNAQRVQRYAQMANESAALTDVAMLSASDGLGRKAGLAVATVMTPSMNAAVSRPLDDAALKRYCDKYSKQERSLENEVAGLVRTSNKARGNEKIVAVLDAIIACKARFDILVDLLRQSVKSNSTKNIKYYRVKLTDCIKTYNALVDRYTDITGNALTKIDADKNKPSVVDSILAGESHEPVPDITYDRDFKAPGDEKVVMLRPGIVVDDAVSTANFADNARLVENANHQIGIDIDAVAKGVEYEIKMIERSENVTQRYRYGISGNKSYKKARERINELKNESIVALEHQRLDNERYYSVVYANPMTVAISDAKLKKLIGKSGKKTRIEKDHDAKTVMHVRDNVARVRSNVIELLDQRNKINAELIALYTGTDVDPNGLPVSEEYQKKRMRAARRAHKRLKGKAKTVKQLSYIGDGTKGHIYDLMNKKIVAESNLELFKYRLKHEKHTNKSKKLLIKDIKSTKRTINHLERDIKGFLRSAVRKQREKATVIWGYTAIVILTIFAVGAITLGIIFRQQLVSWFGSLKAFLF